MDKKVVGTYNGICDMYIGISLSHKKEQILVLSRWMNLEPVIQSEVSQKEEKQIY